MDYDPLGPLGACYWNVERLVREQGGTCVLGWQIEFWPSLYVEAVHHAVWQKSDGTCVDVTQKRPTDHRLFTTFVADESVPIDLQRPVLIPNKYYRLSNAPEVVTLLDAQVAQLNHRREVLQQMLANGGRWTGQGMEMSRGLLAELAPQLREWERHSIEVGAAIKACAKLA